MNGVGHTMTCEAVRRQFSGYLDGAIAGSTMQSVQAHLDGCDGCRAEFAAWRGTQRVLGSTGPVMPPVDLGLRLRLAISHERARRQGHWWDSISLHWDNAVRPFALKFSAGLVSALLLLGTVGGLVGVAVNPEAVQANDEPLAGLTAPRFEYAAAELPPIVTPDDVPLVIDARIDSAGQVYDFRILSGPNDAATLAEVRTHLMVQVYQPAMAFGQPVKGHVLITFAGVSVRN